VSSSDGAFEAGAIMKSRAAIVFSMVSVLASFSAFAQEATDKQTAIEAALSDDTLQFRYVEAGRMAGREDTQFAGAFFLSEERDLVLSAELLFPANLRLGRLEARVGPQVYAALLREENNDVLSMTIGIDARYLLIRSLGLAVRGRAFYGPDILTFGSADNLTDLSARVEVNAGEQLIAFGGMRWFEFDLTEGGGTRTLQEELFLGAAYRF
jgi:hypothetical protein